MRDTLDEEDVLKISDEYKTRVTYENLDLVKTTFPQSFVADERPTTTFPRCYILRTTEHADYDQANELIVIFVLVLESKALYSLMMRMMVHLIQGEIITIRT